MKRKEIKTNYAKVLRRLHTCRPCEKPDMKYTPEMPSLNGFLCYNDCSSKTG